MNYDKLLEPQKGHAKAIVDSLFMNGVFFDGSETGCGKTFCASWAAKQMNVPVVVICPKVVKSTWSEVLEIFGVKAHVILNYEKVVRGNTPYYKYNKKVYDANKEWWTSAGITVNFPKNSLVILDEVHKCRGTNSLNGEMLTACKNGNFRLLLLSASAATTVTEMKSFGFATNLHNGKYFSNFCKQHGVQWNRYGGMVWDADDEVCRDGIRRIHNCLFDDQRIAGRMKRVDFGDIFPDNQILADTFDLGSDTSKLQSVYDDMEAELAKLDERSKTYKDHHFAIIMKARRHSELLKVPVMVDWIEDRFDEGVSPVVFLNFQDTLDAILDRLKKIKKFEGKISQIVGGQSDRVRELEIAEFNADIRRICLVNLQAGSMAVSLHDLNGKHARHTLINPSWSAVNLLQALGRCFRAKGKTPVLQKFLFASAVEERQRQRVQFRLNNLEMLNDGDLEIGINLY